LLAGRRLVERGGSARSFHVGTMNSRTAYEIFVLNAKRESVLNTDEALYYNRPGRRFERHDRVNHSA